MIATILDSLSEGESNCYLCSINLKEYIENLPDDYKDYEVQREIVSNVYLDNLVITVLNKYHIPPIVLIAETFAIENRQLRIIDFKILDGLQRTYRLNAIWKTVTMFNRELKKNLEILTLPRIALSRKYSEELQNIESTTKVLQSVIDFYKTNFQKVNFDLEDGFTNNNQWFEVWTKLEPNEEVNKMLILNAGHKPVKIKHQLELIFRSILPIFAKIQTKRFKFFREKEVSAIQFNKNRKVGEFHFSHLISSILSIKEGKSVTTNSAFIQRLQDLDFDSEKDGQLFSFNFLNQFIDTIVSIDRKLNGTFGDIGLRWFGREVTLVGIFGALGAYIHEKNVSPQTGLTVLIDTFDRDINLLNLSNFDTERNTLDLGKINIGTVNKNAVHDAISDLLHDKIKEQINWNKYFN